MNALVGSNPHLKALELLDEARSYDIYSKIAIACITVISIASLVLPFYVTSMTLTVSTSLISSILVTPLLAWKSSEYQKKHLSISELAQRHLTASKELDRLQEDPEILNQYRTNSNIAIASEDLLPVLAWGVTMENEYRKLSNEIQKHFENALNQTSDYIRSLECYEAWKKCVHGAIPAKVASQFYFKVLENPSIQGDPSNSILSFQQEFLRMKTLEEKKTYEVLSGKIFENC